MREAEELGKSIESIVKAINSISIEELDSILTNINIDTTLSLYLIHQILSYLLQLTLLDTQYLLYVFTLQVLHLICIESIS